MKTRFAIIAGVVGCAVLLPGCRKAKEEQKTEMPPPIVRVDRATTIEQTDGKPFVGVIRAVEDVSIPARVSGWLEKIHFTQGGMVNKGDLLFEIEDTTYQADVAAAQAKLDQVEAEYDYAIKELERKQGLYDKKAVALTDLQNAERLVAFTKAQIAAAKATLLSAENQLTYTRIYAPISGRIGKAPYGVGNYVTPNTASALADIVQVDPIRVMFSISERDYLSRFDSDGFAKDAVLTITTANREKYEGDISIDIINNRIDKATGTMTVWLRCANPDGRLIPNGFVTVTLADRFEKPMAAISVTAIMTDTQGNFVYAVDDAGVVSRRNITLGPVVGDTQAVSSGLEAGDVVIVDGPHKATPGQPVIALFPDGTPLVQPPPAEEAPAEEASAPEAAE